MTTIERVNLPLYSFSDADRLARVARGTSKRWLRKFLALALDEIESVFARVERPFVYSVGRTGTLRELFLKRD